MKIATYSSALRYLEAHIHKRSLSSNKTKDPHDGPRNVARVTHLLKLLGNPHEKYPAVHIGGTSGKSSTSYFLAKILESAGYKTGLTISPHLQVATERMQINGRFVSEREFVKLINDIKPAVEKVESEKKWGKVGYFQILLAAAFLHFARRDVDVAVVEVGIGGHYDSTNVIKPVLAIITNVGLDHIRILGPTVEAIARDKREIIKKGVSIITGATQKSVINLLREKAKSVGASFILLNTNSQRTYQEANILLAQRAARELKKLGFSKVTSDAIKLATVTSFFPGRLEIASKKPLVILDVAHNPDKTRALARDLQKLFPGEIFHIIFANLHHTLQPKMLKPLSPIAKTLVLTKPKNGPGLFKKLLKEVLPGDKILVTGSFFLVDRIRNLFYPEAEVLQKRGYYTKVTSIPS